MARLLNAIED
jgi:hypothetical protein